MFSTLWFKLAIGVALIGAVLGVWYALAQTYVNAYEAGEKTGRAEIQLKLDAAETEAKMARKDYEGRIAVVDAAMKYQSDEAARLIAEANARAITTTTIVKGVIRANPKFAVIERPVDLQRVRADAFAELEAAANRGSKLSPPGVSRVPGTDSRKRPNNGDL